jgi:hypothetical protein
MPGIFLCLWYCYQKKMTVYAGEPQYLPTNGQSLHNKKAANSTVAYLNLFLVDLIL